MSRLMSTPRMATLFFLICAAPAAAETWHCTVPGGGGGHLVSASYTITLTGGTNAVESDEFSERVNGVKSTPALLKRNDAQRIIVTWDTNKTRTTEYKLPYESLYTSISWQANIVRSTGALGLQGILSGRDNYIFVRGACRQ